MQILGLKTYGKKDTLLKRILPKKEESNLVEIDESAEISADLVLRLSEKEDDSYDDDYHEKEEV